MNYFVTGATGFIGKFLVAKLLARGGTVYALVREASQYKLDELRERLEVGDDRIIAVVGDIGERRLGVDDATVKSLAGTIDHFFHLAAIYDLEADEKSQMRVNVDGTYQAIQLAKALKAGCFHHVSSIAAAGLYRGTFTEDMFEEANEGLDNPYFKTKHAAEAIVRKEKKLPWRIYRPGIVVGHSVTGEIDKIDGPYYFFDLIKNVSKVSPRWLPMVMSRSGLMNIVPVDFVVDGMDYLAHRDGLNRKCFFLTDPKGIRVGNLISLMMDVAHGPKLQSLNLPFVDKATGMLSKSMKSVPMVNKVVAGVFQRFGIPVETIDLLNYPTRFDSEKTQQLLAEGDIYCPSFPGYADVIWDYWKENLARGRRKRKLTEEEMEFKAQLHDAFKTLIGKQTVTKLSRRVNGKVVLVTGASSGIGKECALRLAEAGATVLLAARTPEKLDETLQEIRANGGRAHSYSCDISDMAQCDSLVEKVMKDHGRVDYLINNAGRSIRRSVRYSYDRFHDFERTMQLNYFGALRLIMNLLPVMEEQKRGQIINISSIGVLTSPPRFSAYVASKAALDAFSQCVAPEYADKNIRFTTIYMPLVRTPMIAPTKIYNSFPTLSPEEARDLVMKAIIDQPKRISSRLGVTGAVAQATMPGITEFFLNQAYQLFPDSAAARGLTEEEAVREQNAIPTTATEIAQRMFVQIMRGGHW